MIAESPEKLLSGGLNATERRHAPSQLFCQGRLEYLRTAPRIAVVGTRSPTPAGIELARAITEWLCTIGAVVVSGLAKGIDTIAHRTAIERGGKTIAVLGTPLSKCSPAENQGLQEEIGRSHLLVTQFGEEYQPGPKSFPIRNRTIALLSHATILVEAGESSGTQHQAWEAIRLGRVVFIHHKLSNAPFDWPREVLRYGGVVFNNVRQLEVFSEELIPPAGIERDDTGLSF